MSTISSYDEALDFYPVAKSAAMSSKHSISDRVECSAPDAAGIHRQQIRHPIKHLPRGFIRESKQQNISRIDAVLEQVSYSISEGSCLARARARDNQHRSRRSCHRGKLLLVQFRRVIDVNRAGA